jgi:UDP-N-acetylmuramoyl-L-alanyl-D-glutamate--2,6-diaminopimelate ligase
MKLRKLIKDLKIENVKGSKEIEITGICSNSKLVGPGNLFIAKKGLLQDGGQYIPEAIDSGAVAVATDIYNPSLKNVVQILHPDVASIEGQLASSYYQHPSDDLFVVGVTGTNGKTTTSFLIKHLLDALDGSCGLIGTIEYIIGKYRYQATRTTPDVTSNHKMLREMILQGCSSAVMEVTSHALDQGRVQNIEFDMAVFTNLTLDHLDYHLTMENYGLAKNKLFRSLDPTKKKKKNFPKCAIVNADSPSHAKMIEGCKASIFSYGVLHEADLRGSNIQLSPLGTSFDVTYQNQTLSCFCPLIGRFNVYNCLAAIAVGLNRQVPLKRIIEIIHSTPPVPGRLQPVSNPLGLKIYVDFAHTDDALANVLSCLKELKSGRLITVFGCGGDRDRSKRPKMGRCCEELSDVCLVTSDNPRTEDPLEIIRQITQGFQKESNYIVEPDRQAAIEKAIKMATLEDIVLIAGKGHENYQIFAHQTIEFDDAKIAQQTCQQIHLQKGSAGRI